MSTIAPIVKINKTILGTIRELYAVTGLTPTYDTKSTLNTKYGIAQVVLPTSLPKIAYFGIGIGGRFNTDTGELTQPYPVLGTNMDLYTPIPFRCVPVGQDLTPLERNNYRMRVRRTIRGVDYFLYYLKPFTFKESIIQLTVTDPVTKLQTPYVLNYSNLSPTPPTINRAGILTSADITEVNVSITSSLPLTGAEVVESIGVLYNGDLTHAVISEIGLYSGQDKSVGGLDGSGLPITYTEAILAQLNVGYNFLGDSWSSVTKVANYQIVHGSGQLLAI